MEGRRARRATTRCTGAAVLLVTVASVLAACDAAGTGQPSAPTLRVAPEPSARAGQPPVPIGRVPTKGPIGVDPSKSDGIQLDVLSGLLDDAPLFNGDFADPYALRTPGVLYLYASNTATTRYAAGAHVPVLALSRDSGFEGHYLGDALPRLPRWTVSGFQWAPSVWRAPDGNYVLYYSTPATIPLECLGSSPSPGCVMTVNGRSSAMCISRATSAGPSGPFVDDSPSAFVCPVSDGGAIDPSVFVTADGTPWLLWKSDGDCCNLPTTIYSQQLSPDGLSVVGPAHPLIGSSQGWEGGLVEGPSMIENGGTFWLFYSANLWGTQGYGIGLARCASVTGPCTKPLDHAWLSSVYGQETEAGPGGEEFFEAGGLIWMVHHGLAPGQSGNQAERRLYVDLIAFPDGRPPQTAPRAPAAALAEAVLYYGDPGLPGQPDGAFLAVVHKVPGAFSDDSDRAVLADGRLVCTELDRHDGAGQVVTSLEGRGLDAFESDLVAISAAEYLCPQDSLQALKDAQDALTSGP